MNPPSDYLNDEETPDENIFSLTHQTVGDKTQPANVTIFPSLSFVRKPFPPATQHNTYLTSMPITSTKTLSSFVGNGYESNRNILMTSVPQEHCAFIIKTIKDHYQDYIYETLSKYSLGATTMAIVFYEMGQARQCFLNLTHLLQHTKELHLVDLVFCSCMNVSSTFNIKLERLQNTHLYVCISGAHSKLDTFNYKELLESFGELHQIEKLEHSEVMLTFLVEYKDTRSLEVAHKVLHGSTNQGIVFNARLINLELEQRNARVIRRPVGELRSSENLNSPPDMHTGASRLVSPFFPSRSDTNPVFSGIDNQGWISSLSRPHAPLLQSRSTPSAESRLLHGNYQQLHAARLASSCHFTIHPENTGEPFMDWPSLNSNMIPHYYRLQQATLCDSGMSPSIAISLHNNLKNRHDENMIYPSAINNHGMELKQIGLCTPTSFSNGLDTMPETDVQCYFGPPTPSSLASMDHFTSTSSSSQQLTSDTNTYSETIGARDYLFDVNKVINGLDNRTTFMIRNIPNKYTQAMLKECIDATHKGTYDFLYLRIDFKNKCNVGYAFINFIDVSSVISFFEQKVGKIWNRFNSEKKCELSYAKIQGKVNLINKFRNSIVMEQDVSYRPKIFYSDGPYKGEEEEFPGPTPSFVSKHRHSHQKGMAAL
ncbi:unnamed protein product [Absidia cylindrospora]